MDAGSYVELLVPVPANKQLAHAVGRLRKARGRQSRLIWAVCRKSLQVTGWQWSGESARACRAWRGGSAVPFVSPTFAAAPAAGYPGGAL